ncbi:MAG: hypothetical protein U0176_16510 [Bacteroidia bacterium]
MSSPWFWGGLLVACLGAVALVNGYDGLYGQDAYAHLNYARDLQAYFRDGKGLGSYQWPRLYAFLGALWPFGNPQMWMQALSIGSAGAFLALSIQWLRRQLPGLAASPWLAPLAFAMVGCSPLLLRNSISIMADAPSLACSAGALLAGAAYQAGGKWRHLVLAGLGTGGAIALRYPAALVMLPMGLVWAWEVLKRRDFLAGLAFILLACLPMLPQLLLPAAVNEGLDQPFRHQHFIQWRLGNFLGREFVQMDGYNAYPFPNLIAALSMFWHPRSLGLGCLSLLALPFLWRKMPKIHWPAVAAILVNTAFLAGIPFQNPRFLLPELPFVALLLLPIWIWIWENALKAVRLRQLAFALMLMANLGLGYLATRQFFQLNGLERTMAAELKARHRPGQQLFELSLQPMLRARDVPQRDCSMWEGGLPEPKPGDLLLFNLPKFGQQFAGMWPMKNWDSLHEGWKWQEVRTFDQEWKLYEIR